MAVWKLRKSEKIYRWLELLVFFVGLPVLYLYDFAPGFWKVAPLLFFFAYCLVILTRANEFTWGDWNLKWIEWRTWVRLLLFPMTLYVILFFVFPGNLFADFDDKKVVMAIIAYPLFSSLPQEIIYRKFFYYRYHGLISQRLLMWLVNAALFAFAHIYFGNYVALIMTFFGGLFFSWTYISTRSLLFVSIEHSIYGLALLCSVMNQYFYKAF